MLGLRPDFELAKDSTEEECDWQCEDLRAEDLLDQITKSFDEDSEIRVHNGKAYAKLF